MASSKLSELKSALAMGARGNKYQIQLGAPVGPSDEKLIDTICKGGSIPAKTMGQIEVWTQGRKLVIAGDATYDNAWSLTFYNTQDHALRSAFDDWLLFIDNVETHSRGATDSASYMAEATKIIQLNTSDNSPMATYEFRNLWPTGISAIDMAADQQDTVTEFTCDLTYSHWLRIS